jgi:ATP-dependent helicase/nuclease subunit A
VRLGDLQTVGSIYVGAKLAERRRYEQSRVLYVAMTRAKRRLVLSAGLPKKIPSDSFLSSVTKGIEEETLANDGEFMLPFGSATIPLCVVSPRAAPRRYRHEAGAWREADDSIADLTRRWDSRTRRHEEASTHGVFTNPTALKRADVPEWADDVRPIGGQPDQARLIGILAHRILEGWDFGLPVDELPARVQAVCRDVPPAFR